MPWDFFLVTLKIGALAFGGGYAMITPLHYDLVTRYGWLTETEFGSAVAMGQISPGPLMLMIAFMGYKIAGLSGAILGTVGLFLPTTFIVLALAGSYMQFKDSPMVKGMMRVIGLAVIGLLASVVIDLAKSALASYADVLLGIAAFVFAGPLKRDPIIVLIAAGFLRLAIYFVSGS